MPLGQLILVKKNEGKPLRADQRSHATNLPAAADQAERSHGAADGGGPQELTDRSCSEGYSCLPRSAELRRRKVDLLLHEQSVLLRSVLLSAAVQVSERRWLLAATPRRGCLMLGAARRTSCLRRHRLHFVMPNVRAKRATTAGRQARAGENVPRTACPGLVACRWRSA